MLRDQLGESGLDAVGGTINNIGLRTGLWGTNDAYLSMRGGDIPTDAPGQPSLRPPTKTLPTNQRGQNFDDPRTVNADPSRASLGTSRDFSNELNGAKKPLPSDLREGVIHKTVDAQGRTTYSGRNVGMNANDEVQMVDGKGQQLRMLNGRGNNYAYATDGKGNATGPTVFADGNTGTVSSNGGTLRAGGDSNYEALMAAAKRGDVTALREYYGNKGQGFGGQSFDEFKAQKAQQAQAAEEEAMFGGMGKNHRAAAVNQYRQTQTAQDHNKVLREGWPVTRTVTVDGVDVQVNAVAQLPAGALPAFIGLLLVVAVLIEPYVIRRRVVQRAWARLRGLPPPPIPDLGGVAIEGAQTKGAASDRAFNVRGPLKFFFRRDAFAVVLAIALWMVGFSLRPDYWWNLQNSFAILLNYTEIALLAIGVTYVIANADIDLSVGAVLALSASATAFALKVLGYDPMFAVMIGLAAGAAAGLINAILTVGF